MFLFTVLMGNGFAAFPIMTAAIGWPVLVLGFHGNPAIVFAIGMLAGFCGTLCTPMAANFNLVPSALLEMKNKYGVITGAGGHRHSRCWRVEHRADVLPGVLDAVS